MGGVGIWDMHYLGNRAVLLDHDNPDHQIEYDYGLTSLSFFVPVLILFGAFYRIGLADTCRCRYIIISGMLTGAAACTTFYIAQLGIANYTCSFHVGTAIGSALIAVGVSIPAFGIFFRLREMWKNVWWTRVLCAAVLALAVSGMNWTATAGTSYRWKRSPLKYSPESRRNNIIFCGVMVS